MQKRIVSIILSVLLVATLLSGCGSQSGEGTTETTTETTTATSTDDDNTLTIIHMWTDELVEQREMEAVAVKHALENFKEKYPDVTVIEEQVSQNAGYESKIKTLAAANELPDLFGALPSMMGTFYDNGQVMDLAPVLAEESEWYNTFADGAFGDFQNGDAILGVPRVAIVNHVLYWNEAIFKECGIAEYPKNEQDFLEAVKILKENGYVPMATGNKGKFMIASQVMPGILFKYVGKDWYENLRNFEGASFEDPESIAAITYLDSLIKAGLFNEDANSIDEFQAREMYYSGKAAMYVEGSWSISSLIADGNDEIKENTNFEIFTTVEGKEDLEPQIITGQGWGFSLNANLSDKKKENALNFLKELTSPEIQKELVESGSMSILKNVDYDESKLDPLQTEFLELYSSKTVQIGCPEVQLSTAYMDASYTAYQELSVGDITPEELAKTLQKAHESSKK